MASRRGPVGARKRHAAIVHGIVLVVVVAVVVGGFTKCRVLCITGAIVVMVA